MRHYKSAYYNNNNSTSASATDAIGAAATCKKNKTEFPIHYPWATYKAT